jgi:hypothetical protein
MERRLLYLVLRTTRATHRFRPLQKFARVARANTWESNECVSNRSYLCLTITTATSANVAPQFCLVFHSQIFAGSPDALASDKFNPNQAGHSSFSLMTN